MRFRIGRLVGLAALVGAAFAAYKMVRTEDKSEASKVERMLEKVK
ncbi:MAG: hypothetical protein ACOYU7_02145 [Bacillota bacterium]